MKREYVKPVMQGEAFVANEYVAACWKINCNVETGIGFIDVNDNGRYDGEDEKICQSNPRSGCGEWHTGVAGVPDDGPKANAMWQPTNSWGISRGSAYGVYWWSTGSTDHDQHFSKASAAQWETNPNAS